MAKRGRSTLRRRVAGEAARRAEAARRLAQVPPSRRAEQARAEPVEEERLGGAVEVPGCGAGCRVCAEASACAAGCRICAEAKGRFDAIHAESLEQRRRFDEPGRYPYAAGKHALHRATCREAKSVGDVGRDDSAWMLVGALRDFAHEGSGNSGWMATMRMMEPGEAAAWVAERTGPRGGRSYRLCKICTPELPIAD